MPLRPAKLSDIPTLSHICNLAFFEEDLFGNVMHPLRHKYPDHPARFWTAHLREQWCDWRNVILVATAREDGTGKTVGVAVWQRQGDAWNQKSRGLRWWDPRRLLLPLVKVYNRIQSTFLPNLALDPTTLTLFPRSLPYSAPLFPKEHWYLSLLAVSPTCQRGGFGRELVRWGIEASQKEKVHASVMSSEGSDGFYLKCGFDKVVGNACQGEGNPLGELGVSGGNVLLRFPQPRDGKSKES